MELYLKVRLACAEGLSQRSAAKRFNVSRDTDRNMLSFSSPPGYRREAAPCRPKLDGFVAIIDGWLDGDRGALCKQRHTAKRVFDRLRQEHGFTGGYTLIKDYVREREQRSREMFVPLAHPAGDVQADFGERNSQGQRNGPRDDNAHAPAQTDKADDHDDRERFEKGLHELINGVADGTGGRITVNEALIAANQSATSPHSIRALTSDLEAFDLWCRRTNQIALQATPVIVAAYLDDRAGKGAKLTPFGRYRASSAKIHQLPDLKDPIQAELVRLRLGAIRRENGVAQARPLRFKGPVKGVERDKPRSQHQSAPGGLRRRSDGFEGLFHRL